VKKNREDYNLPLKILSAPPLEPFTPALVASAVPLTLAWRLAARSYQELYGWTMDEIVAAVGRRGNCTFCGVFRRQALDRGAALLGANKMARPRRASPAAAPSYAGVGDFSGAGETCSERSPGGRSRGTTRTTWRRRWRPARSTKLN
jgi:hypothetical protein